MFEIYRSEAKSIKKLGGWILIYGRRKVGKTFLIRNELKYDCYALVTRIGVILVENEGVEKLEKGEDAINAISENLKSNKCVVIDEFQRLDTVWWDRLSTLHPKGKLIVSGSSRKMVEEVLDKRSPLLGLFSPVKLATASYSDSVVALKKSGLTAKDSLTWGSVVRDPWIIPMISLKNKPEIEIAAKAKYMIMSAYGLVGEAFEEEGRALTEVYDSVLRLVGSGIWKPSEIAGILSSTGKIEGGLPTVMGILRRMSHMGMVERVPLWRTKGAKYYYRASSTILSILYYLDQRYNISEQNYELDPDVVNSLLGKEVQFSVASMLASHLSGREGYSIPEKGGDVDIVILDKLGKRAIAAYELKVGKFSKEDSLKSTERLVSLGIARVGLVSLTEKPKSKNTSVETLGPDDLVTIAERLHNK